MTAFLQISTNFSALNFPPHDCLRKQRLLGLKVSEPITIRNPSRRKIRLVYKYWLKTGVSERKLTFLIVNRIKDGTFIGEDGWKKSKRVLLVRFNGLGSGGGGYGCGEQKRFFRFWAREEKKKEIRWIRSSPNSEINSVRIWNRNWPFRNRIRSGKFKSKIWKIPISNFRFTDFDFDAQP